MADLQQLAILNRGVTEWNLWRTTACFGKPDLRGAVLNKRDLRGVDFHSTDLYRASLWRTDLSEADLRDADCSGVTLNGAVLARANLTRTNLRFSRLVGADVTGLLFEKPSCMVLRFGTYGDSRRSNEI
jgi:uncharacterized protein YjbI with pentapeptide repeats